MSAPRTSRFVSRRIVPILLAAICLAAQGAPALHNLAVQHTVCAVHGDAMHAEAGASTPDVAGEGVSPGDFAPSTHVHDHCPLAPGAREDALAGADVGAARAGTLDDPDRIAAGTSPRAPLRLFLLAPKASPPA